MRHFRPLLNVMRYSFGKTLLICLIISLVVQSISGAPLRQDALSCQSSPLTFASNRNGDYAIYYMPDVCNPDQITQITFNSAVNYSSHLSSDGKQIIFASNIDGNWEIYKVNVDGTNLVNLTNNSADDLDPAWKPGSDEIAFTSNRSRHWQIYTMDADGSHPQQISNETVFVVILPGLLMGSKSLTFKA